MAQGGLELLVPGVLASFALGVTPRTLVLIRESIHNSVYSVFRVALSKVDDEAEP